MKKKTKVSTPFPTFPHGGRSALNPPEIVRTKDGSDTLFVSELNEHYHSVHGAIQESDHIFIRNGVSTYPGDQVRIFEVGFGTGLNTLLTLIECIGNKKVLYTAIENYPLESELVTGLNYPGFFPGICPEIFKKLHSCRWDVVNKITETFRLHKMMGDLTSMQLYGEFDIIYFDAFGPEKQPEMWSDDIFRKISGITARNGILVTYSAKGEVKRSLIRNGFKVSLLPGPPGKRHFIRAVKI